MAAGSTIWGQVATHTSISVALLAAALGAIVMIPLTWRAKLGQAEGRDLSPSMAWATPIVAEDFDDDPDRGPVLVTITYEVDPDDAAPFLTAMHELSSERYRDGAHDWGVYQDAADPRQWIEWFFVSSWAEHLRQHDRVTRNDQDVHDTAQGFHRGATSPEVRHYLAAGSTPSTSHGT